MKRLFLLSTLMLFFVSLVNASNVSSYSNDYPMIFSPINKGSFLMGCHPSEKRCHALETQRPVTISFDYEMLTTEVTQAMYFKVTGENPSAHSNQSHCPSSFERRVSHTTGKPVGLCPNYPVEQVTVCEAQRFVDLLSAQTGMHYRLPTNAEWEYAERGGGQSLYHFGSDLKDVDEYALHWHNAGFETHLIAPVRQYSNKPNGYGLYDMAGHVWEWVIDRAYSAGSHKVPPGGKDPVQIEGMFQFIRGHSYNFGPTYFNSHNVGSDFIPWGCRDDLGFRIIRTAQKTHSVAREKLLALCKEEFDAKPYVRKCFKTLN